VGVGLGEVVAAYWLLRGAVPAAASQARRADSTLKQARS
jgi:hypothetical protein